jgi:hypothetical protein
VKALNSNLSLVEIDVLLFLVLAEMQMVVLDRRLEIWEGKLSI